MGWVSKINNTTYGFAALLVALWVWAVTQSLFQSAGEAGAFWVVALIAGPFICTVIHEIGHALFACASGWHVARLHAAPFAWRPSDGRFAVVGALGGQDLAGYCAILPGSARANRVGYILGVLGGPLASAGLAVAAFALAVDFAGAGYVEGTWTPHLMPDGSMALQITPDRESWTRAVSPFFGSLAAQSAYVAVFSLWPAQVRGHKNDGAIIANAVMRGCASGNAFVWVNVAIREGVSPRDWPRWIAKSMRDAASGDEPKSGGAMCALYLAIDSAPPDAAAARRAIEILRNSEAFADDQVRNWLLAWDATVAALFEDDADRAEARIQQIDAQEFGDKEATLAARAAIFACRGETSEADEALTAMRSALAREPMRATAWKRLEDLIRKRAFA